MPAGGLPEGRARTITLYRAVSSAELDDIVATGSFRQHPTSLSYAAKLFATTIADAMYFGRSLYRFDLAPFTIVEASVPRELFGRLHRMKADRRPIVVVDPELLGEFNAVASVRILDVVPLEGG